MKNRRSYRLPHWDYASNGAYFVTICSHERKLVFGEIRGGIMGLNRFGCIVWREWELLAIRRKNVMLDEFCVMPNHLHLIIWIERDEEERDDLETSGAMIPGSLGAIMRGFKSGISREIGKMRGQKTMACQERFYDRVVRDEDELMKMRRYIRDNPANWQSDKHFRASSLTE